MVINFLLISFLTKSKKKYIIDTDSVVYNVSYINLILIVAKSLISFLAQVFYLLKLPFIILKFHLFKKIPS